MLDVTSCPGRRNPMCRPQSVQAEWSHLCLKVQRMHAWTFLSRWETVHHLDVYWHHFSGYSGRTCCSLQGLQHETRELTPFVVVHAPSVVTSHMHLHRRRVCRSPAVRSTSSLWGPMFVTFSCVVKLLLCVAACRVLYSPPLHHNRMTNIRASPGWREVRDVSGKVCHEAHYQLSSTSRRRGGGRTALINPDSTQMVGLFWSPLVWRSFWTASPNLAVEVLTSTPSYVLKSLVFTHAPCDAPNVRVDQRFAGCTNCTNPHMEDNLSAITSILGARCVITTAVRDSCCV